MGTILTVKLGAVAQNYKLLCKQAGTKVAGVLKADAYGLGMEAVATTLMAQGCTQFFVVTVAEGVRLRRVCPHDIYVLGGLHSGNAADIAAHRLIPVLNSLADIQAYGGVCAIHFDTGMNRLGLGAADTQRVLDDPALLSHLDVRVALSHFVAADEENSPITERQRQAFARIRAGLQDALPHTAWSLCNSSGLFGGAEVYDMVRPGYALYGGNPTPWAANKMQPTVALDAVVLQVREVQAGMSVGYNATHIFPADTTIVTVCLGYADGLLRSFSGKGVLYWRGVACPIVGRVSMDSFGVDIGHLADKPQAGDTFEVIGPHQDIDQLAALGGTIGYEILTSLGSRYQRVYIEAS